MKAVLSPTKNSETYPLNEFLNYLSVEKGLADNSLAAYRQDLTSYHEFLEKIHLTDWSRVKREHIVKFLMQEKERGLEGSTVARRLVAVKLFHRFLVKEHKLNEDITSVLESPKLWKKLPHFLSTAEMEAIMKAPAAVKGPAGVRDTAMLECLYAAGLRVSEITGLKLNDVNLENGFIKCFGKGGKERIVPVGRQAVKACRAYLEIRSKWNPKT